MTDEEVICTAMEARPLHIPSRLGEFVTPWWIYHDKEQRPPGLGSLDCWTPVDLTLDRLWLVEERLTDEQWDTYAYDPAFNGSPRGWLHATPEQKIKALAAVLRPTVESGGGE